MFKVGDVVKVCASRPINSGYQYYDWISEMNFSCGKEYTVTKVCSEPDCYHLSNGFYYYSKWLESPIPLVPIVKIFDMGML